MTSHDKRTEEKAHDSTSIPQKIDAEIMYELRRQGMTNKQIAENLDCCIATVYNTIGKKSYAVANAEAQNKPPVVDPPKTAEIGAIEAVAPKGDNCPTRPRKSRS